MIPHIAKAIDCKYPLSRVIASPSKKITEDSIREFFRPNLSVNSANRSIPVIKDTKMITEKIVRVEAYSQRKS